MIDQYIRLYGKRLYGLCLTLCASRFDADDLYQETWVKVVRNISQYNDAKGFEPWLTTICVNTYRNKLKRIGRSPIFNRFSSNDAKDSIFDNAAAKPIADEKDYAALYEAIDKLPTKLRITVVLFYFRDMDIAATASVLSIPAGTVKSRLSKARKLLKEVLSHETDLQF